MATMFLGTRFQSFKSDGTVNATGTVEFYVTGTSTHKTTYSDSGLSVANTWPVTLDASGSADIWYSGDADVTVKDNTGTTIDTFTSINPSTASTAQDVSLITNGSFETGTSSTNPDGWTLTTINTGATSIQDTTTYIHGKASWKFVSVGNGGGILTTSNYFYVAYNNPLLVTFLIKSSVANVRNTVDISWYDNTDSLISTVNLYDDAGTSLTSWTLKSAIASPPANAVEAKLVITGCHSSNTNAGTTWYDNVVVTNGALIGANNTFSGNNTWTGQNVGLFSTGDVKLTIKTAADSGWVLMDDGTIGDASSSASTRANADTSNLFSLIWTNISNTYCPIYDSAGAVSTRGATAAADYALHKRLRLPRTVGRAMAGAGSTGAFSSTFTVDSGTDVFTVDSNLSLYTGGVVQVATTTTLPAPLIAATNYYVIRASATTLKLATSLANAQAGTAIDITDAGTGTHTITMSLTSRSLGEVDGEEAHSLTSGENGPHTHTKSAYNSGGTGNANVVTSDGATTGNVTTNSSGSGTPHNNMQPTTFLNVMIKL